MLINQIFHIIIYVNNKINSKFNLSPLYFMSTKQKLTPTSFLNPSYSNNEDVVLQQFYQQRKKRQHTNIHKNYNCINNKNVNQTHNGKRHSLLQRNFSFFDNMVTFNNNSHSSNHSQNSNGSKNNNSNNNNNRLNTSLDFNKKQNSYIPHTPQLHKFINIPTLKSNNTQAQEYIQCTPSPSLSPSPSLLTKYTSGQLNKPNKNWHRNVLHENVNINNSKYKGEGSNKENAGGDDIGQIKSQIKQRKMKVSQKQILSKYMFMTSNVQLDKQNCRSMPGTPQSTFTMSSSSTKTQNNTNNSYATKNTKIPNNEYNNDGYNVANFKKLKTSAINNITNNVNANNIVNNAENQQKVEDLFNINVKTNKRKKSLHELQKSFKNLTGQQFNVDNTKIRATSVKSLNNYDNTMNKFDMQGQKYKNITIKQKLQNYISNKYNQSYKQKQRQITNDVSSQPKNQKTKQKIQHHPSQKQQPFITLHNNNTHEKIQQTNDIKIINRTRSKNKNANHNNNTQKIKIHKLMQSYNNNLFNKQQQKQQQMISSKQQQQILRKYEYKQEYKQKQRLEQEQEQPLILLAQQKLSKYKSNKIIKVKDSQHQNQKQNQQKIIKNQDNLKYQYNYQDEQKYQDVFVNNIDSLQEQSKQWQEEQKNEVVESPNFKFYNQNQVKYNKANQHKNLQHSKTKHQKRQKNISQQNKHNNANKTKQIQRKYNQLLAQTHKRNESLIMENYNNKLTKQLEQMKLKLTQMEKTNKKQNKFIESVQGMRKTLQNTSEECNLKQLWRWVKSLPYKSSITQGLAQ